MFLAVDAGNTKITFGFFEKGEIKYKNGILYKKNINYTELKASIKSLSCGYDVSECMISSVVDELTDMLKSAISEVFNITPHLILPQNNVGIIINTSQPEKCGADRIANAYASLKLYGNRPIIVVDSGSATTFDVVNKDNVFAGGLIMPGLDLQLEALGEKTSKLPKLDLDNIRENINVIADNTEDAIYAGVVIAHAQAIQGLITLCEQELGEKAYIVGTGGNINLVAKYMNARHFDVVNPNLTLEGIRLLFELNKSLI